MNSKLPKRPKPSPKLIETLFHKNILQLDFSKMTLPFALIQIVLRGGNGSLLWLFYFNGKGTSSFYLENSFLPVYNLERFDQLSTLKNDFENHNFGKSDGDII